MYFYVSAGLHLTTVGPFCLRCFLRIYYTLLYKGTSRLFSLKVIQMSTVSVSVCRAYVTHCLFSTEWGKYNGGGSGWSLWLLHTRKGELVFKFHISPLGRMGFSLITEASNSSLSSGGKRLIVTLMFVFPPASHGAQSAKVKLLSSVSLWPALLPPGLWRYLSTR